MDKLTTWYIVKRVGMALVIAFGFWLTLHELRRKP
jgi:ABC-type nickel/cobalt efflux system permease component RcnA